MGIEEPTVDFLMLADRAEAINGKMYVMGGAWDRLHISDFQQAALFGIAVGILVPWTCTNQSHSVELQIQDADGRVVVPPATTNFVAGRPPTMGHGESQRVLLAVNGAFLLPRPGAYRVVASIDGSEAKQTVFYVSSSQPQPRH